MSDRAIPLMIASAPILSKLREYRLELGEYLVANVNIREIYEQLNTFLQGSLVTIFSRKGISLTIYKLVRVVLNI